MKSNSTLWWLACFTCAVTLAACNIGVQPPSSPSVAPQATPSIPATEAPTGSPAPSPTFASPTPTQRPGPTLDIRVPFCEIHVTGYVKLDFQPCGPPSGDASAGGLLLGTFMVVYLTNYDGVGVMINVPENWLHKLGPGKYVLADSNDTLTSSGLTAEFAEYEPAGTSNYVWYESYAGGTVTFTETDNYAAGSFDFGARDEKGRQINVVGTFKDIPFTHVYPP